jgi:phage nucleotide-binding protein
LVQIRKPSEKRWVKSLVFAPSGAGKTVLLGTAQEDERTSPMMFLDFEGGDESLAGLDIDVAEIRSWDDWNEIYEMLVSGDHGYKSLGVDSISETHKWALLTILDKEGDTRKNKDLLEQRDYGTASVQVRRLMRAFRDLPMHVFFTAHAKEVEFPREGRIRVPDLAGQMAEEVAGLMSVVGYLAQYEEEGELHRTLLLHSFPKYRIKVRTPWGVVVNPELEDPTVGSLLDLLEVPHASNNGGETRVKPRGVAARKRPSQQRREKVANEAGVEPVPVEGEDAGNTASADQPASGEEASDGRTG